jgi:hypothetical protein
LKPKGSLKITDNCLLPQKSRHRLKPTAGGNQSRLEADLPLVQTPNEFGGISRGASSMVGRLKRLTASAWLVRRLDEQ